MLKINKILLKKIKFPLSLRGLFPFCHSRESGNPSSLSLRGAKRRSNLSGFSLIELMVAAAILALAIFGIFQAYSTGFLGMFDARDRTVATNYVQEKMEELKNADFDAVVGEATPQIVGDIKFSRNVNVEYIDGSTNLIVAGPTNLKRVTTTVNWTDRNGVAKKVESSVLIQNTQFTPGDAARISLYADPYNVVLPITSSTTIIAVIKDKSGNTIFDWDGSDVTFTIISEVSVEGESLEGLLGTLSGYSVTPVQGKASVVFTSSVAELQGTVTIEASVTTSDGLNTFTDTIDIKITWGAVKIELIPDPSSIYADGSSQSTIIAIIENAAGVRVVEAENDITFTVAGEGILIGPTTKPANETYNGDTGGVATILLQSTTTPGIATVTANSPELLSDSCDVQTSGEPAGITITAFPDTIYNDDTSILTIKIVDINGVPVAPIGTITVNLSLTSGSIFLDDTVVYFNMVSSQTRTFIPTADYEGTATITADDEGEILSSDSVDINVLLSLVATKIELDADPPTIPVDGGTNGTSVITATIKDDEGNTVHNFIGDVTFYILNGVGGTLSGLNPTGPNPVACENGIATIELVSGSMPGTCIIQAENYSLPSPSATIDVGFYTMADYILLNAVPVHIPVGGGDEGTSILTASIKDAEGTTVYNYDGDVLFSFLSVIEDGEDGGYMDTAKFKYVDDPSYNIPVFNGTASVYVISLNNSGDAKLKATENNLDQDQLNIYIEKTLKEPRLPNTINVVYDINNKGVFFDIEVLGGNMQINTMRVSWSPDIEENQLLSIEFPNGVVFSGSILNGQEIDITGADTELRELLEGLSTIYLGFLAGITDKDITVIFYPFASDYHADSYEISF